MLGKHAGAIPRGFAPSCDGASRRVTGRNASMYFVYFLKLSNDNIYKGSCNDLRRRIGEHEMGKVESTKNYPPIKFMGYEAYALKSDAIRRERFLKTTEGRRLLRRQYRDILEK